MVSSLSGPDPLVYGGRLPVIQVEHKIFTPKTKASSNNIHPCRKKTNANFILSECGVDSTDIPHTSFVFLVQHVLYFIK